MVSAIEPHLTLVETGEQHWSVVHRPDPVVDLLESDVFTAQRLAREDATVLPAHHPVVLDLSGLEMAGVLDRRERFRIRPRRGTIDRHRSLLTECLVRALLVVYMAELVKALLLPIHRPLGRSRRLG